MNLSAKTFIFLFGVIVLAIVIGKLTGTWIIDSISASQAANAVAASETEDVE